MTDLKAVSSHLMKFSAQELSSIIPLVLEVDWDSIKEKILRYKLCFQKKFIVQVATDIFERENKPTKADCESIVKRLKLYDVAVNKKFEWKCAQLMDQTEEFPHVDNMERKIKLAYKQAASDTDLLFYTDEPLVFIMSIEKRVTKKGVKYNPPVYFVLHTGLVDKYIFYSAINDGNAYQIDSLCKGLGYDGWSAVSLIGKDVYSMFETIERSQEAMDESLPIFDPIRVREEDGAVDFTLKEERSKYAGLVFPGGTNLSSYTVHANNRWKGSACISDHPQSKFQTSLKFVAGKNGSVEDVFRELVKAGMVKFPLPSFMANIKHVPKNDVSYNNSSSDMGSDSE